MIRPLFVFIVVSGLGVGSMAKAADMPSIAAQGTHHRVPVLVKPKAAVTKPKKAAVPTPRVTTVLAPADNQIVASREIEIEPSGNGIEMSWVLDPLVANADGSKTEGSASVEGNLVVVEPGSISVPNMVIELTGHIIKTSQTKARLDIKIGDVSRTVSWQSEDVQSGRFKILLNAPMREGKLPEYFPISVLAFATKDGKDGAVLVSLEKIVVRLGKVSVADSQ